MPAVESAHVLCGVNVRGTHRTNNDCWWNPLVVYQTVDDVERFGEVGPVERGTPSTVTEIKDGIRLLALWIVSWRQIERQVMNVFRGISGPRRGVIDRRCLASMRSRHWQGVVEVQVERWIVLVLSIVGYLKDRVVELMGNIRQRRVVGVDSILDAWHLSLFRSCTHGPQVTVDDIRIAVRARWEGSRPFPKAMAVVVHGKAGEVPSGSEIT